MTDVSMSLFHHIFFKMRIAVKEIRPVFRQELDYFGFNNFWKYPDTGAPLLFAVGSNTPPLCGG
jgi:hypothetical protein